MNNFTSRLLVGAAYVAITVVATIFHQLSAAFYIWGIQALCLYEFYTITIQPKKLSQIVLPQVVGSFIFIMAFANQDSIVNLGSLIWLLIPLLLLFMIAMVFYNSNTIIKDFGAMVLGWLYISLPLAFLLRIGNLIFDESNTELFPFYGIQILIVFILIWASDTFAYLIGRKFGKTPLAPKLSPKKSVEGFIGGIVCTILFALALHYFFPFMAQIHFVVLALICAVVGSLGDLFESKIKRSLGIKDSGTMLGGHGGFLDRMDSILFASPACFFYLVHFSTF